MKSSFTLFRVKLGWMGLVGNEKGMQRIFLPVSNKRELVQQIRSEFPESQEKEGPLLSKGKREFIEYFGGRRMRFTFSLDLSEATCFQKRVYRALSSIPFGETRTYRWLAQKIGNPRALRAVGGANAHNRWPLVIPCHRVVGSDGRLTGFSAPGGLALKASLLKLEGLPVEKDRVRSVP